MMVDMFETEFAPLRAGHGAELGMGRPDIVIGQAADLVESVDHRPVVVLELAGSCTFFHLIEPGNGWYFFRHLDHVDNQKFDQRPVKEAAFVRQRPVTH